MILLDIGVYLGSIAMAMIVGLAIGRYFKHINSHKPPYEEECNKWR